MPHYHLYRMGSVTFFIIGPFLCHIIICIERVLKLSLLIVLFHATLSFV